MRNFLEKRKAVWTRKAALQRRETSVSILCSNWGYYANYSSSSLHVQRERDLRNQYPDPHSRSSSCFCKFGKLPSSKLWGKVDGGWKICKLSNLSLNGLSKCICLDLDPPVFPVSVATVHAKILLLFSCSGPTPWVALDLYWLTSYS